MTTNLFLLAAFVVVMLLMSFNYTRKKKKILFLGDSITAQATQPGGFITRLQQYVQNEGLSDKYELTGSGVGGNKIYDLILRLDSDVINQNADTVVVNIGTNDIWHKVLNGTGTDAGRFEIFYESLVQRLLAAKMHVILCTPAVMGEKTDFSNDLDSQLLQYSEIIRKVAATNNLSLVDLRKAFVHYNQQWNTGNLSVGLLTTDGVHLNEQGNKLVAEEIAKVMFSSRP